MRKLLIYFLICLSACSGLKEKLSFGVLRSQKAPTLGEQQEISKKEEGNPNIRGLLQVGPTLKEKTFFKDVTDEYGLANISAANFNAVDFDSDGKTDLVILPDNYSTPLFYRFNSSQKKFLKLDYSPFEEKSLFRASYLVFYDFDRDGILDFIAATVYQKTELLQRPLRLFKGFLDSEKKIHYREIENAFPSDLWGPASVALLDFDLDGNLDLYLGNWYNFKLPSTPPVPDVLLKGEGLSFKNNVSSILKNEYKKNRDIEIYKNATPTFGVSICDIDQNGYPDILTVSSGGYPNKLWINSFTPSNVQFFEDFAKESGYAQDSEGSLELLGGGNGFYSLCADYNNDGIFDIAYGSQFHRYDSEKKDRSAILTGKTRDFPPSFVRTTYEHYREEDDWSQSDRRGIWADFNNDSLLDLLVENSGFPPMTRMVLFEQEKNHSFNDKAKEYGLNILNPTGTVILDFDGDGKMDLLTAQNSTRDNRIKNRIYLFKNELPTENGSLRIHLRGTKASSYAIGASILLKTSSAIMRQVAQYSFGPLPPQNEEGMHFGLGISKPLKVSVSWPISVTDKLKRESAKIVTYDLSSLKLKKNAEIYLCESGKVFVSKFKTCR